MNQLWITRLRYAHTEQHSSFSLKNSVTRMPSCRSILEVSFKVKALHLTVWFKPKTSVQYLGDQKCPIWSVVIWILIIFLICNIFGILDFCFWVSKWTLRFDSKTFSFHGNESMKITFEAAKNIYSSGMKIDKLMWWKIFFPKKLMHLKKMKVYLKIYFLNFW